MDFEEILSPVDMYRDRLKAEHEHNTEEAFEKLVLESGVDIEANAAVVKEIRKREREIEALDSSLGRWRFFRGILVLLIIAGIIGAVLYGFQFFGHPLIESRIPPWLAGVSCGAVVLGLTLIIRFLNPKIRIFRSQLEEKKQLLESKLAEAWEQMAALNRLFQWDTMSRIVMKTLPILKIDQYFSRERMDQLCRYFHWDPEEDAGSVLCCQSGTVNGNPWIMAEMRLQSWGTQTYYGSITISWKERVSYVDSQGKTQTRWETRYETLTASVEKPKPFYNTVKFLVYGNEAAPELVFSREPNSLADAGTGFFGRRKLKGAIDALEKKSRDMSNTFIIMDNREFDACFNAVDRDNEQQFRLLFTPLAQQEMLKLLRDREQGFGDDFSFRKKRLINLLFSTHLSRTDFSGNPAKLMHYEFAEIKKTFLAFSNDFFRSLYFTFAPLFCIPLYQQHRNFPDIYNGIIDRGEPSSYEFESLANSMDEDHFRPPQAITDCILKTSVNDRVDSEVDLTVTAHAFRGEERIDHVSKYGGDGRWHSVPVHWTEYLPVTRSAGMTVCEAETSDSQEFLRQSQNEKWQEVFSRWNAVPDSVFFRRNLAAFLQNR